MQKESIQEMLDTIGIKDISELFSDIPGNVRVDDLNIAPGLSENEAIDALCDLFSTNKNMREMPTFIGGGVGRHYIPSVVNNMLTRSEFYTAYTPYQPEVSQGTLQGIFEYQSYLSELTQMDVINASIYDSATSLAEAVIMATTVKRRKKVLIPRSIDPEKKEVISVYAKGRGITIEEVPFIPATGQMDLEALRSKVDADTAGVYIETPNFFGVFEESLDQIRDITGDALLIAGIHPLSLPLIRPPGDYGADIVIGEGQPLGNPVSYGGPLLGIFGCTKKLVRRMPGKVVGMTADSNGERAFAITLQTREQHIRREKATSNICTNEALCALGSAIYMASMGKTGMTNVASANINNAQTLAKGISQIPGITAPAFDSHHFNSFVVRYEPEIGGSSNGSESSSNGPVGPSNGPENSGVDGMALKVHKHLLANGVHGGHILTDAFPELGQAALYGVSELHTQKDFEMLLGALKSAGGAI